MFQGLSVPNLPPLFRSTTRSFCVFLLNAKQSSVPATPELQISGMIFSTPLISRLVWAFDHHASHATNSFNVAASSAGFPRDRLGEHSLYRVVQSCPCCQPQFAFRRPFGKNVFNPLSLLRCNLG